MKLSIRIVFLTEVFLLLENCNSFASDVSRDLDNAVSEKLLSALPMSHFQDVNVDFEDKEIHCIVDIKKLRPHHALIIDPLDHAKFLYPNERGLLELEKDESLFLSCPGSHNNIDSSKSIKSGLFKCVNGTNVWHQGSTYSFNTLTCKNPISYEIKNKNMSKVELGYVVDQNDTFLPIMEIGKIGPNPYASAIISRSIAGAQKPVIFRQMNHENNKNLINLHRAYKMRELWVSEEPLSYLTPGLLIPKPYFVYSISGHASHSYLNSAPIRNNHLTNWRKVQDHIHRLTRQLRRDIRVFSGTLGALDSQVLSSGHSIPQYFWILAYEPISKTAVAFVTHNSVETKTICKNPVFRNSRIEMPRFWQPTEVVWGYSYMCEVRDFLKNSDLMNSSNPKALQDIYRDSDGLLYLMKSTPKKSDDYCRIRFDALTTRHPLFLDPRNLSNFVYPVDGGEILLAKKDKIVAVCPGKNREHKIITCNSNTVDLENELRCQRPPEITVKNSVTYRHKELIKLEVGYETVAADFAKLMDFYYDTKTNSTMYVRSTISRNIAYAQKPTEDQDLEQQDKILKDLYKFENQERNLDVQVHCQNNCGYLNKSLNFVLVPQQMTPKSSLMHSVSSKAAELSLNLKPMWKSISRGNWARIENHVNELASDLERDLTILTGATGNLKLRDILERRSKSIYLDGVNKRFEVPLYFWKIVYDPEALEGIVFVTANNPHLRSKTEIDRSIACLKPFLMGSDIEVPKNWNPVNIGEGYSYMCKVSDFLQSSGLIDYIEDESLKTMSKLLKSPPKLVDVL